MSVVAALHLVITAPRPAKRKDMDTQAGREVREDESIPELEEDDAVVKQVASEFSAPSGVVHAADAARLGGVSSNCRTSRPSGAQRRAAQEKMKFWNLILGNYWSCSFFLPPNMF